MKMKSIFLLTSGLAMVLFLKANAQQTKKDSRSDDVARYTSAMLGTTPIQDDLQELCDQIGGRATGSDENLKAVEWGLKKFQDAGVSVKKEEFTMPSLWLEKRAQAWISGDLDFSPTVVSMPFSAPTRGTTADLIFVGRGTDGDFKRLAAKVKDNFILVETEELLDVDGLFKEYFEAAEIEIRANAAGVKGLVYMASRPKKLLYRHNASLGEKNTLPMMIMAREDAMRCARQLQKGGTLKLKMVIEVNSGGPYPSYNVIAEIKGSEKPDEIVLVGAHLDSWELGTGANDNGCNAAMMIDLARQMKKLNITPKRTIRFALWNGEEQGIYGSMAYTLNHESEMDKHIMAMSMDIGSGRITGFFTGGRKEVLAATEKILEPISGFGPYVHLDAPVVGTDNFDFMMEGVANLVANQESANYGPNYHAQSDTYDKVDFKSLKINSAIAAAVVLGFANSDAVSWKRQSREDIDKLIQSTDLGMQMKSFNMWDDWVQGKRGRKK
jgi:carboxypeptidase Q